MTRATNSDMTQFSENVALKAALEYHGRGFCIIPMRMQDKRPAWRWKTFQNRRPGDALLRKWFGNGASYGLGVIFGSVSAHLGERDFDELPAYDRWAAAHPELAGVLPTVETRRGRRVLFKAAPGSITRLRQALGKPRGTGAIICGDGELRAGIGCYSVLPPSVHPSGHVYRWLVPLPDGPLPMLDPAAVGFAGESIVKNALTSEGNRETEAQRDREIEAILDSLDVVVQRSDQSEQVQRAIVTTLPTGERQRNSLTWALARALKAVPGLADASVRDLLPIVRTWHKAALPVIGTEPFDATLADFTRSWKRAKFPAGVDPMAVIVERAKSAPLPEVAEQFDSAECRLLVVLCRELQRSAGDAPFYLSCYTAGRLLNIPHKRAWQYLGLLVEMDVLTVTKQAKSGDKWATRYRYLASL
jgi:hypothetical protein